MNTVIINGKFMADRMQGIVRYARELCDAIDKNAGTIKWFLAIPCNAINVPDYKNITVLKIGSHKGILWEQLDLRSFVNKNKNARCLNFCNVTPFFMKPGITTIHDVMYKANPQDYKTIRNRLSRIWHCFQYFYICKHEKVILTDSNYSKSQIEKYYPSARGKIQVVKCGWQHVNMYKDNPEWEQAYPFLKKKEFYFSLSTLSRNKNGKWIVEVAKRNPNSVFAIAGKYYESDIIDIPRNVYMLGFVSDEDACSLIKNCKAFIHPALYEGFGLPPLEAMALGAVVISSNLTSLPEVLNGSVHYVNPYDYDIDLDVLLNQPVEDSQKVLQNLSWKESATNIISIAQNA